MAHLRVHTPAGVQPSLRRVAAIFEQSACTAPGAQNRPYACWEALYCPPMSGRPEEIADPSASDPQTPGAMRLRVRYCECDPMGVAHHASYVAWLEMGRTELLRHSGLTYADMEREGFFLVVTKLDLRYRRPIRYDDLIEVRSKLAGFSRIKLRHEYELAVVDPGDREAARLQDNGGVCAAASSELACVGPDGRPREMPDWLSRYCSAE